MRKFRVAKRVLMLVLCGMLAVPAAGMLARPWLWRRHKMTVFLKLKK